jgi:hypothetical protein
MRCIHHQHNDHITLQSPASTNINCSVQASIAYDIVNARDSNPQDDEDAGSGASGSSSSGTAIGTAAVIIAVACALVIVAAVIFRQ